MDNNCNGTTDDDEGACQCSIYVPNYSSVNAASGNLSHSEDLFSSKSAGLTTSITLYYNSNSTYTGPLGKKWTHTYDVSLVKVYDGSMVLHQGNGKGRLYTQTSGGYTSQPGDYSVLTKNNDGTLMFS